MRLQGDCAVPEDGDVGAALNPQNNQVVSSGSGSSPSRHSNSHKGVNKEHPEFAALSEQRRGVNGPSSLC